MKKILSQFQWDSIIVRYYMDTDSKNVGLALIPANKVHKAYTDKDCSIDPLVHIKLAGDAYPDGFSHGLTMRNSESTANFKFEKQYLKEEENSNTIVTVLKDHRNFYIEHHLKWYFGCAAVEAVTIFENLSSEEACLEMLSSFSLGELTPFEREDAPNTLIVHRLRSAWSAEGRLESVPVEDLQLEPSWSKYGVRCERFGQVGSMPVRGYFPFAAIEDRKNEVSWAAQIACPASWQLELYRRDNALCISGGLADREFGHWYKKVKPGEKFTTPKAIVTVSEGGVDEVAQKLTDFHWNMVANQPEVEADLPIIFNEFCTTWGNPSEENLRKIAEKLKGRGIKYFVIDCGWYKQSGRSWDVSMGDWELCQELFPGGLDKTLELIRQCGMIPGIWFEFEICGRESDGFYNVEHMLKRDNHVITTGNRRFWDMTDEFVIDYLQEKVINFIKKYNFGYLKIDYNDNIGIGCDGADSLGEGLRQKIEATQNFIKEIRRQIPDLVIENCSSGGHRLEPSMMALTDMSSFSDAHECVEIPIIAANLHRAVLPSKSQIWAVLRKDDSERRLVYSLASTFLGRMCLSGDVYDLNNEQWDIVARGIEFYKKGASIIKHGFSRRFGTNIKSYRHPEGWQAIIREGSDGKQALVVVHTFGGTLPESIQLSVSHDYRIDTVFSEKDFKAELKAGNLIIHEPQNYQAIAIYLCKGEV